MTTSRLRSLAFFSSAGSGVGVGVTVGVGVAVGVGVGVTVCVAVADGDGVGVCPKAAADSATTIVATAKTTPSKRARIASRG